MNALQDKECGLLNVFLTVCRQLGLKPFVVCGTALGAVKYQGFIPWDDDVDVALLRPDYERFIGQAAEVLPEWCFVQNCRTEPFFPHIYTKLRDTRTIVYEESERMLPITRGAFIDVFPLDGYPEGRVGQMVFEMRKQVYIRALNSAFEHAGVLRQAFYGALRVLGCHRHIQAIAASYERMLKSYPPESSRLWCNHGNWQGRLEYAPREQYGKGRPATFEGIEVLVPENYDDYLSQKYGDWRSDPPLEKQTSHHGLTVVNIGYAPSSGVAKNLSR